MAQCTDVVIGGETYSLDTIPKECSALVQRARQDILGDMDLGQFTNNLSHLGKFIRLAYYGVNGYTDLKIKVQMVGIRITKLSDKSAITIHSFGNVARDVLDELQASYQYLLDGMEEMALENISQIDSIAKQMVVKAGELSEAFTSAEKEIEDALKSTHNKKGKETEQKQNLETERQKAETNRMTSEGLKKGAKEAIDRAEESLYKTQKKEDKVVGDQMGIINKMLNMTSKVASTILRQDIGAGVEATIKSYSDEKMKYIEDMQKQRDLERQAIEAFGKATAKIAGCKHEGELADAAIYALHNAITAIQNLVAVLMSATKFWQQVQDHCKTLQTENTTKRIKKALKTYETEEKRIKVWTSNGFIQQAAKYYSRWVALDSICTEYMASIKETRAELYEYMKENPTVEESRSKLPQLAGKLAKDLDKAKKALDEKDTQAVKELKQLKDGKVPEV